MSKLTYGVTLAVLALLTGCAASPFAGYVSASAEDERRVAAGEFVEAASAQIVIAQHPDINGGKLSPKAVKKIQQLNISCQKQVHPQLAGAGQQTVTGVVGYGLTGFLGGGGGGMAGGYPMPWTTLAPHSGVAYGAAGGYTGAMGGGFAMASATGTCTERFWRRTVREDKDFDGAEVIPAYYGKRWGGSVPPALDSSTLPKPQSSPAR